MEKLTTSSGISPEGRLALAEKEKVMAIKQAEMLRAGGKFVVDENDTLSYQFSQKQLDQREKESRKQKVDKFCEKPEQAFKLGVEVGQEETRILEEMVRENRKYILDANQDDEGQWTIIPTDEAIKEIPFRKPCSLVPAEQLLKRNEMSEYPSLPVDDTLTLDQAIAQTKFGEVDEKISCLPFESSGEKNVIPVLVRLSRILDWEGTEKEIEKMGLRSANLRELLAFAAAHPNDPNWDSPIIALGVRATIELKEQSPYIRRLSKDESRKPMFRALYLAWVLDGHKEFISFANILCVKKTTEVKP